MGKKNRSDKFNKSVIHIKNSKSKSNKHIKRGRKGKDCIFFDGINLTCGNGRLMSYNQFCKSESCKDFKSRNVIVQQGLSGYDDTHMQLPTQQGTHEKTNEYIAVSKNIGIPCHVGYLKDDGYRRHKARCIYYDKVKKFCEWFMMKCTGSSKCDRYEEKEPE